MSYTIRFENGEFFIALESSEGKIMEIVCKPTNVKNALLIYKALNAFEIIKDAKEFL